MRRRTLWSLLVSAAACLPAVHGAREVKAAVTPPAEATPATRPSPGVDQTKRSDQAVDLRAEDRHEDDPSPIADASVVRSVQAPPAPRITPCNVVAAPRRLAFLALGLPFARAPDARG